jgi:hypothetical protein
MAQQAPWSGIMAFASVVIGDEPATPARFAAPPTAVEILINDAVVRVPPGSDERILAMVLRTLKGLR